MDLYCGMGGLGSGFAPFFTVLDAVDLWKDACATYHANHPTTVREMPVIEFLDKCIPKDYDGILYTGIVGGPPCQEFSVLNQSPDLTSPRAGQLLIFLEAVKRLRPEFAMIENVATIPKPLKDHAVADLRRFGYKVTSNTILAYHYGSVQKRRRWILTACRSRHVFPQPLPTRRTAKEILRNYDSYMAMSPEIQAQLQSLPRGKWVPLPGKHWKEYFIVDPDQPLPAIVNVLKNRIVRPDRSGYVSLREIALAQGFSENYRICGGLTSQAQQLANAVPVELARTFAAEFGRRIAPDRSKIDAYFA